MSLFGFWTVLGTGNRWIESTDPVVLDVAAFVAPLNRLASGKSVASVTFLFTFDDSVTTNSSTSICFRVAHVCGLGKTPG